MVKNGYIDYNEFYNRSIEDISWFWGEVEKDLGIVAGNFAMWQAKNLISLQEEEYK